VVPGRRLFWRRLAAMSEGETPSRQPAGGRRYEGCTVQFRIAAVEDVDGITAVINAAFRKAESFFIERDRIDAESVRVLMAKGQFLLAEENRMLRGCLYLERPGERTYLGLLAVDPRHQGTGIGSRLMTFAEEHCAKAGARFMDLRIVNLRTENHAFYKRRGYVETGTEPLPAELTTKLPCHFVKMSKPLD
jgi:GNAT superfamily N-acetyltransferase